jgi:uncharacterized protein YecT (DUF1311 family)
MKYFLATLLLILPFFAHAQSFDCAKATTNIEKMICADEELQHRDEDLAATYQLLLKHTDNPQALRNEQRAWLKSRDAADYKIYYDDYKLVNDYSDRITELGKKLSAVVKPSDLKDPKEILTYFNSLHRLYYDQCRASLSGYNINATDASGKTLLMYAAHNDCLVAKLVEAGANVDAKDSAGKTAMDYAETRKVKVYLRSFSKLPIKYTDLPNGNNPDNSQFCRDIAADKINFEEDWWEALDNSSYTINLEYVGTGMFPRIFLAKSGEEVSYDSLEITPQEEPDSYGDYSIMSYKDDIYAIYSFLGYKNYYKFLPERVDLENAPEYIQAFEPICELVPGKRTFTVSENSPQVCRQVIAGDYEKIELKSINIPISEDNAENNRFIRDYETHCEENMYDECLGYLLADYNNDNLSNTLILVEPELGGGMGCYCDLFYAYDINDRKFVNIVEPENDFQNNRYFTMLGDYDISCQNGAQEIIKIDGITYLLTTAHVGIDKEINRLHKITTNKDGLNELEELCSFGMKYEHQ